jgi:hypothetical protein
MALNNVSDKQQQTSGLRHDSVVSDATDSDPAAHQTQGLGLDINNSVAEVDTDRRLSAADTTIETPIASRRPSQTTFPTIIPPTPQTDHLISPKTQPSLEVEVPEPRSSAPSPLPSEADTEEGSDITQRERKISTSTLGLKKPGVGLRIKRRDREVSSGAGVGGHEKGVTESSSGGSEILVSPRGSVIAGHAGEPIGERLKQQDEEEEEMKRASRVSTGTVAFGTVDV